MKQTEILTRATHVNGWFPAVYMSCMSQNFRLFHVSNLSVRNIRIFLLMYTGSVMTFTDGERDMTSVSGRVWLRVNTWLVRNKWCERPPTRSLLTWCHVTRTGRRRVCPPPPPRQSWQPRRRFDLSRFYLPAIFRCLRSQSQSDLSLSRISVSDLRLALRRRAAGPAARLTCLRLGARGAPAAGGPALRPAAEPVGMRHEQCRGAARVLARPAAAAVRHHDAVVLLADGDAHLRVEEAVEDGDEDPLKPAEKTG